MWSQHYRGPPTPALIILLQGGSGLWKNLTCPLGYEISWKPQREAHDREVTRERFPLIWKFKVWFLQMDFFFDSRCTLQNFQIWRRLLLITTFVLKFCRREWALTTLSMWNSSGLYTKELKCYMVQKAWARPCKWVFVSLWEVLFCGNRTQEFRDFWVFFDRWIRLLSPCVSITQLW